MKNNIKEILEILCNKAKKAKYSYFVDGIEIVKANKEYYSHYNTTDSRYLIDENNNIYIISDTIYDILFDFDWVMDGPRFSSKQNLINVILEDKDYSIKIPKDIRNSILNDYSLFEKAKEELDKKCIELQAKIVEICKPADVYRKEIDKLEEEFNNKYKLYCKSTRYYAKRYLTPFDNNNEFVPL